MHSTQESVQLVDQSGMVGCELDPNRTVIGPKTILVLH
jgi:hypothetical protein